MTSKRANWLFLVIILVHFGVVMFLLLGGGFILDSLVLNFLVSQGILIVPTLVFLLIFGRGETQSGMSGDAVAFRAAGTAGDALVPAKRSFAAAFHKVRISTLLMIVLCTLLIMPLVAVFNILTMFFTNNAVAALEGDIVNTPFPAMLFMIGIFGPFCEEFVFRGVIYGSYRKSGGDKNNTCCSNICSHGISAVLLSALLFGLMHMNFNQALYAFVIGIFLAVLVEAAGSLWASVFCHMVFNSCQVVMMYVSGSIMESIYGQAANEAVGSLSSQELLAALSVYLIIASVTTPILGCVIVWIAKNEGRQEALGELFGKRPAGRRMARETSQQPVMQQPVWMQQNPQQSTQDYLLSVPLMIAIVLCLGYMSLEFFL